MMAEEWMAMYPEAPATEAIPAITLEEIVSTLYTQLVCS